MSVGSSFRFQFLPEGSSVSGGWLGALSFNFNMYQNPFRKFAETDSGLRASILNSVAKVGFSNLHFKQASG